MRFRLLFQLVSPFLFYVVVCLFVFLPDALIQEILAANCDRSCILEAAMMSSELRTSLKINFDDESTFPVDIPMPDFEGYGFFSSNLSNVCDR